MAVSTILKLISKDHNQYFITRVTILNTNLDTLISYLTLLVPLRLQINLTILTQHVCKSIIIRTIKNLNLTKGRQEAVKRA